jgi:hypothetical protein
MATKRFVLGLGLGIICGVLATSVFYQATQKPVVLTFPEKLSSDSTSHEDTRLDNLIYLGSPTILLDRVSLESSVIDINDLYKFVGKSVKVSEQFETTSLKDESGDSILQLSVKKIDVKPP